MKLRVMTMFAAGLLVLAGSPANAQTGEALFNQRCGMCHQLGQSLVGPDIKGLTTPSVRPAFNYSPAIAKLPARWTAKRLDAFLASPQKVAPGTAMMTSTPSAAERGALISYLK